MQNIIRCEKAFALVDKVVFTTPIRAYVQGSKPDTVYRVDLRESTCECPDFIYRGVVCKHIRAAQIKSGVLS